MTITNNNVTNSYQYVIKNNGTPDTPTTCKHDWQETIDTAPTCLEGGHASYTCSKCGETYEQILAAKGHDWKVIEHVNMVYNSDGTVATQGHALYQCSVCGEQWYTDTGAPPPDVSGSSSILAWLQEFKVWLGDKLDNLFSGSGSNNFWTSTKDTVADVLSSLLEALLGFITDILGAILDLVKELLSFFFDLLSSVVISGISGFFSGLKDSRLFDFAQKGEDGSVTALKEQVAALVKQVDPALTIHDFRVVRGTTHDNLIFDAVLPFSSTMTPAQAAQAIRDRVRAMDGNYYAVVTVEHSYTD